MTSTLCTVRAARRWAAGLALAFALAAGLASSARPALGQPAQDAPPAPPAAAPAPPAAPAQEAQPALPAELVERARALAAAKYEPAKSAELTGALAELDYDRYRRVRFKEEARLWRRDGRRFQIALFHRGYLFTDPVKLHERTPEGLVDLAYAADQFDFDGLVDPASVGGGLDYAGFRVLYPLESTERLDEVASFLGASYFRILGESQRYGASARGLAIDTGLAHPEEFPQFVEFWLQRPEADAKGLSIHALLDGPRVAGAYSFLITPGPETRVDVRAELFLRAGVAKFGVAPLTSMFFFGESNDGRFPDYRPEVHDSDGLLVQHGAEWTWRPLSNPVRVHRVTRFEAAEVNGFGLLQRDRRFENYQDLESRFERRPSLWVQPAEPWKGGAVELLEIPMPSEFNDNIAAFWVPGEAPAPGVGYPLAYSILATSAESVLHPGLRVQATRRVALPERAVRFVLDFVGASGLDAAQTPVAYTTAVGGALRNVLVMPNPVTEGWRLVFDLFPEDVERVDLTARLDGPLGAVSETWSYSVYQEDGP